MSPSLYAKFGGALRRSTRVEISAALEKVDIEKMTTGNYFVKVER